MRAIRNRATGQCTPFLLTLRDTTFRSCGTTNPLASKREEAVLPSCILSPIVHGSKLREPLSSVIVPGKVDFSGVKNHDSSHDGTRVGLGSAARWPAKAARRTASGVRDFAEIIAATSVGRAPRRKSAAPPRSSGFVPQYAMHNGSSE